MSALVLIPSAFQGHHVSEEDLDLSLSEARANGRQVGNLNAGYHCDPKELNDLHPFWATDDENEILKPNLTRISFNTTSLARDKSNKDVKENTDFMERGERPLGKVADIVEAVIKKGIPIWKIVSPIKDKFVLSAMDLIFEEVLGCIKRGETYRFCDSSSLRLKSSPSSINTIETAYVSFRYIAGFPPLSFPPLSEPKKDIKNQINVGPCKTRPRLVRQAPRSVYCCPSK